MSVILSRITVFFFQVTRNQGDRQGQDQVTGGKASAFFIFPPRYLTHEDALARVYGLTAVRDIGVLKGLKATWNWVRALFGLRPSVPEPIVSTLAR